MSWQPQASKLGDRLKQLLIGPSIRFDDKALFRRLSIAAFFAWIGLGADGLSSSCYGPAEAFAALGKHHFLAILVGFGTVLTIFVISLSYGQIIEQFPRGGGGYLVASELLSPGLGMISGCALVIDYALTITLSVASGTAALFSMLPFEFFRFSVPVAVVVISLLTVLNLRGPKESIRVLTPIFMLFVLTHAFAIGYTLIVHALDMPAVALRIQHDVQAGHMELGTLGLVFLMLKAYSLGAGTYTGLEAVSNGLPMLKEPRVQTGKRTMLYMATSLSITVMGLMLAYVLFAVVFQPGKTLNAVLFEAMTATWPQPWGQVFVSLTLLSEALILYIAAQTGFLDGPRVMANMALDRWLPSRFSALSDRLVMQNGMLYFSLAAVALMILFEGSVSHLVVLYSINVFITFVLSQASMVRHWLRVRENQAGPWRKKMALNAMGLCLTSFILVSVTSAKFMDGGWITLVVTSCLALLAVSIRRHYAQVARQLQRLDHLVSEVEESGLPVKCAVPTSQVQGSTEPTAVVLVNGYNGLGVNAILKILESYEDYFTRFIFIQVGTINASIFKQQHVLGGLEKHLQSTLEQYTSLMQRHGFHAESQWAIGTDVVHEVMDLAPAIVTKYPKTVFFGGQLLFSKDNLFTKRLHNSLTASLQRKLFQAGQQFVMLPVMVPDAEKS